MKQLFLTMLIISTIHFSNAKRLLLTNPVLKQLDGIPLMIDGEAIHDIRCVIQRAKIIQNGQLDKATKKHIGIYQFNNQPVSVHRLAIIEKEEGRSPELNALLDQAKKDFMAATKKYLADIQSAKHLIVELMKEFCEKRKRPESPILAWAQIEENEEEEFFMQDMTSLQRFDTFLDDLSEFLMDLMFSCEKAVKQYREWYLKNKIEKQ